ncbi:MAG: lasso peptide biosynthesis protein [Ktedonobacteraceae bacterium]|nr:lasso peptide biosynthesis protein [Ktedonobacteraceae bacterium]
MTPSSNLFDIYESIAIGFSSSIRQYPRHPLICWLRAIWWGWRMIASFDAGGSRQALDLLAHVSVKSAWMPTHPASIKVRNVQRDAATLRSWLRLFSGGRACFSESLALCAGLRCLGWETVTIVGIAQVEVFALTNVHAWVAFRGVPVSDCLDVRYGYVELQRYGE